MKNYESNRFVSLTLKTNTTIFLKPYPENRMLAFQITNMLPKIKKKGANITFFIVTCFKLEGHVIFVFFALEYQKTTILMSKLNLLGKINIINTGILYMFCYT